MKAVKKTIRSQIMHGYIVTIAITVFLVLVSTMCLFAIRQSYLQLARTRSNQISTQEAVTAHYKWLDSLNASLQTGVEFTGSLDHTTCALGKWMSGVEDADLSDDTIRSSLDHAQSPHQIIHSTAQSLLDFSARNHEAAYLKYTQEIKPLTDQVIADLTTITAQYKVQSDAAAARLQTLLLISLVAGVVLALLAAFFALTYAKGIAKKISRPVTAVADWSDQLSRGMESLDTQSLDMADQCVEILRMISSFGRMAANIRKNVNVVQRVADGDMTAYVHIRSAEDSLGKHLYRMVQNNDLLFAEILQVAESVAEGAKEISSASQNLANSVNVQAISVSDLSQTVSHANDLVVQTLGRTQEATRISDQVQATAAVSREKMSLLVESVDATRDASKRISAVIKSIEDIAFQTNILALNAAVEAARAGAAGKGFAVVAGEVRILALKSAEAAEQTKVLIENSIRKTEEGSIHSQHAAQTLEMMLSEIGKIDALIQDICTASQQQSLGIKQVHQEIDKISSASTSNAAISEESAAASQMMHSNAETLRGYMTRFNLRQRKEGQAYIPPEKRNDPAFIHAANERFRQAQVTGTHLGIISDAEERDGVLKY